MNRKAKKVLKALGIEFCYLCKKKLTERDSENYGQTSYWDKGYRHRICRKCWKKIWHPLKGKVALRILKNYSKSN
jgi:hypothetical protein